MQLILNGIIVACIIGLGAAGYTLVYALLGFPNIAYGELMILGAYVVFAFNGLDIPIYAALLLAIPIIALANILLDRIVFKRLRNAELSGLIMASFGVALFLRNLIRVIWGTGARIFAITPVAPIKLPFGMIITIFQVIIICSTVLLIILLHLFLNRTKLGKATRAIASNPNLALISGIDAEQVITWVLAIAGALAVSGGAFLGIDASLNPLQGWRLLLPIYAAAIFGRIGSMYGALLGALVIGLAQEGLTAYLPTSYKPGIAFVAIILIILARSRFSQQKRGKAWI